MTTTRIIQHSWEATDRLPNKSDLWGYITKPVELTFADPPYNYGVAYEDDSTEDCLSPNQYRYWCEQVMRKMASMTKPGGKLFWLCPAKDGDWAWAALQRFGDLLYGQPIIWHERFSQYQAKRLTTDYRLLFPVKIGVKEGTFNPNNIREESVRQKMGDKRADPRGRVPGHVWTVSRLQGNNKSRVDWHPAQLPPTPLARIVLGWTDKGDTVLDAFAGGGSMGVVCKGLGRNFVGVEQSKTYCDLVRKRIQEAPNVLALPTKRHV